MNTVVIKIYPRKERKEKQNIGGEKKNPRESFYLQGPYNLIEGKRQLTNI